MSSHVTKLKKRSSKSGRSLPHRIGSQAHVIPPPSPCVLDWSSGMLQSLPLDRYFAGTEFGSPRFESFLVSSRHSSICAP
eukprot:scaffold172958_cov36-Tisochrysis_lutea.AAC.2